MSNVKSLVESVNNLRDTSPLLILGEAYYVFRKAWKDKIVSINSENVKEIVEYYSSVKLDYPLVLEDLALLSSKNLSHLLKLIEETKSPVILLASFDNINEILLSRIKTIIKFNKPCSCEFKTAEEGLAIIDESLSNDSSYNDILRYQAKYSPMLYYIESSLVNVNNKRRYINILS